MVLSPCTATTLPAKTARPSLSNTSSRSASILIGSLFVPSSPKAEGRSFPAAGATTAAAGAATPEPAKAAAPRGGANPLAGGDSAIRKINCKGPVTIVSKTQVATGDNAEFDRAANKVVLVGNAALSDGPNVTRGERVAYDINTGIANVVGGRVRALIVPGSQNKTAPGAKKAE